MKIEESQIQTKAVAGQMADGNPVAYILTKGGLHAFFTQKDGKIEALAAAPHLAIARHFAEKKSPGIKWEQDYMLKSEVGPKQMEKYFFLSKSDRLEKSEQMDPNIFMVFELKKKSVTILDYDELKDRITKGEFQGADMVRPMDLSVDADFIEDMPDFKETIRLRNIVYPK